MSEFGNDDYREINIIESSFDKRMSEINELLKLKFKKKMDKELKELKDKRKEFELLLIKYMDKNNLSSFDIPAIKRIPDVRKTPEELVELKLLLIKHLDKNNFSSFDIPAIKRIPDVRKTPEELVETGEFVEVIKRWIIIDDDIKKKITELNNDHKKIKYSIINSVDDIVNNYFSE